MNDTIHFHEPRAGHGLPHDPFNAIVGPRPIGWMSTRSPSGVLDLAPYSFFNAFDDAPPIVGFARSDPNNCSACPGRSDIRNIRSKQHLPRSRIIA